MIISVDTEIMNRMALLAQQANDEIDRQAAILSPVTEHYDWNCFERDIINEAIISIKNKSKKMQETIENFSSAIRSAAEQFNAEENAIPGKYQYLDALLGNNFSSVSELQGSVTKSAGSTAASIAENISLDKSDKLENYEISRLVEPIQVISFSTISPVFNNGDLPMLGAEDAEMYRKLKGFIAEE